MAADITATLGGITGGIVKVGAYGIGIILLAVIVFVISKKGKEKKSFNIPCTIIIPRSNNTTQDIVHARGGYFKTKPVGGVTVFRLKRKGVGTIELPPPSSRYLMGYNRELYLIQKGMDDFEPVIPESFTYVEEENTGKKLAVVKLKCINQDATAWKFDNEENAKQRFTFHNFWEKYKDLIQITIFIFIVFIAAYIQWSGLKEVADSLKEVARLLQPVVSNMPVVTSAGV